MRSRFAALLSIIFPLLGSCVPLESQSGRESTKGVARLTAPVVTAIYLRLHEEQNTRWVNQAPQAIDVDDSISKMLHSAKVWQQIPSSHPLGMLVTNRRIISVKVSSVDSEGSVGVLIGDGFDLEKGKRFELHSEKRRILFINMGGGDAVAIRLGWGNNQPTPVFARAVEVKKSGNSSPREFPNDVPLWMAQWHSRNGISFVSDAGNGKWVQLAADPVEIGRASISGNKSSVLASIADYEQGGSISVNAFMPDVPYDLSKITEDRMQSLRSGCTLTPSHPDKEKIKGSWVSLQPGGSTNDYSRGIQGEYVVVFFVSGQDHIDSISNHRGAEQAPAGDVLKAAPEE